MGETELKENQPPAQSLDVVQTTEADVDRTAKDLSYEIAAAKNSDDLEGLAQKFRINDIKKEIFNTVKYREVLDTINKEAADRITKRPSEISNKELLDYMNAYQNQLDRAQKSVGGIKDINAVQVNNTQNNTVNIHVGNEEITSLSKDSRDRITSLVTEILKESNKNIVSFNEGENADKNAEVIEVEASPKESADVESDEFEGDE